MQCMRRALGVLQRFPRLMHTQYHLNGHRHVSLYTLSPIDTAFLPFHALALKLCQSQKFCLIFEYKKNKSMASNFAALSPRWSLY